MATISGDVTTQQRQREDALVRQHLGLVAAVVSEMATKIPRHVSRADLTSAGMEGLAQAARNFDPERGIPFDRYASTRIRGSLLDELRRRDWASRSVRSRARSVGAVAESLTAEFGRLPTNIEVAHAAGMDVASVASVHNDVHRAVVLNYDALAAGLDAEVVVAADPDTPDSVLVDRERKAYLLDSVAALPPRLRRVVIGYFFEERAMQDLADELGVTESRISQMRAEALELLKDGMNSQLDPDLLPEQKSSGRVARRKAAYFAAVAAGSDYRTRISARSGAVHQPVSA
ncbi:MAG: FliA/WhiG family RNA polymerase sigma factor [Acidimicrobiales bacterium]